jgi:hypothetical protein
VESCERIPFSVVNPSAHLVIVHNRKCNPRGIRTIAMASMSHHHAAVRTSSSSPLMLAASACPAVPMLTTSQASGGGSSNNNVIVFKLNWMQWSEQGDHWDIYNSKLTYCDVTIACSDGCLLAHSSILSLDSFFVKVRLLEEILRVPNYRQSLKLWTSCKLWAFYRRAFYQCPLLTHHLSFCLHIMVIVYVHYPTITYYWTVSLILDHSYLVGNLTNSKIAETKALEPLKSWHFCISNFRTC